MTHKFSSPKIVAKDLRQFLLTYGRYRKDGMHHRQRAEAFMFAILLVFSISAHETELDAATMRILAALGDSCTWCAVAPY